MSGHWKARLVETRDLAPSVRSFTFEAEDIGRLHFTPGQFVSITEEVAGKKITRAYSIASPPDRSRFEFCLNLVEEGIITPVLFEMKPGEEVNVKGPYGVFVWRQPFQDALMVAMGTGIAPIRSMLQARFRDAPVPEQITLLFGARNEEALLYREEFEKLTCEHPNFRFWPTLTRPGPYWRGRTGRVQAHLAEAAGDRRDLNVYICGLREMVEDVRSRLMEMGFDRRRLIYERYD